MPVGPYLDRIGKAVEGLETANVVLGGDVNARNTEWGCQTVNRRGAEVASALDELELHVLNQGSEPTFDTYRGGRHFSSRVAITACSNALLDRVEGWQQQLSLLKADVLRKKRRIRYARPARKELVWREHVNAKEVYLLEARCAQTQSSKQFCERQDRETMLLAEVFFPEDNPGEDNAGHRTVRDKSDEVNAGGQDETSDPPYTMDELQWSVSTFNAKKSPGADGLTADICRAAVAVNPVLVLALSNRCLALSHFPTRWKETVVVALRKPDKEDYAHPESYMPIGFLPILGKVLEK
ncbi:uncharacterized protein [Battus philenor]|uniref:uncharacterized protein n=1 Tax=Battus philenor TaxID=42288 RepID=UPI0035CF171A